MLERGLDDQFRADSSTSELGTFATVEDARRWIACGPRRTFVARPGTNALEPTQVPLIATLDQ